MRICLSKLIVIGLIITPPFLKQSRKWKYPNLLRDTTTITL
jgi:hypothetical protein